MFSSCYAQPWTIDRRSKHASSPCLLVIHLIFLYFTFVLLRFLLGKRFSMLAYLTVSVRCNLLRLFCMFQLKIWHPSSMVPLLLLSITYTPSSSSQRPNYLPLFIPECSFGSTWIAWFLLCPRSRCIELKTCIHIHHIVMWFSLRFPPRFHLVF